MKSFWVLTLLLAGEAAGATIHVNNVTGNDTRTGASGAEPVATLRRAVQLAQAGDTILLASTGVPFRESLSITSGHGGKPDAPLVVEGCGAVLTGLRDVPPDAWQRLSNGIYFQPLRRFGANNPYLVGHEGRIPSSRGGLSNLAPGQHYWATNGVYFLPEPGRTPADYALKGLLLGEGVAIRDASYVTVRNLTCEYFSNDGFNVHGESRGLLFENIVSRHNGDDGFSIHEDVGAIVRHAHLYDNDYGIQDINASQSLYNGVLVESNRLAGVHLIGGLRSLVDARVRNNNGPQVWICSGLAKHLGFTENNPLARGVCFIKNCVIQGGDYGLRVSRGGSAVISQSVISGCATGLLADAGSRIHMLRTVIHDCGVTELAVHDPAEAAFSGNLYYPGRFRWGSAAVFGPDAWAGYQKASGQDADSSIAPPQFTDQGLLKKTASAPLSHPPPRPGLVAPVP